jgi:hypothetical protein
MTREHTLSFETLCFFFPVAFFSAFLPDWEGWWTLCVLSSDICVGRGRTRTRDLRAFVGVRLSVSFSLIAHHHEENTAQVRHQHRRR